MRPLAKVAVLAAGLALTGPAGSTSEAKPAVSTLTVRIENMQFTPTDLAVHRGDRIVWVNKDFFPHTATANDKTFDSGSIASNGSWTFEATRSGDFPYGCTFHPTMKARISVR